MANTNPAATRHGAVALRFAEALAAAHFDVAHSLLSPSISRKISASELKLNFEQMIAYGRGAPDHVEVMNTLEEWPAKAPEDTGWVYVAITGPGFSEAVTVVVTEQVLVRDIDWGRP